MCPMVGKVGWGGVRHCTCRDAIIASLSTIIWSALELVSATAFRTLSKLNSPLAMASEVGREGSGW